MRVGVRFEYSFLEFRGKGMVLSMVGVFVDFGLCFVIVVLRFFSGRFGGFGLGFFRRLVFGKIWVCF